MYCLFFGFYDWIFTLSVGIYCNYARKQKRHPVISNRVAHNKCYSWKKVPVACASGGNFTFKSYNLSPTPTVNGCHSGAYFVCNSGVSDVRA